MNKGGWLELGREKRERGLGFGATAIATQLPFVQNFTSRWIICYYNDIFKDFIHKFPSLISFLIYLIFLILFIYLIRLFDEILKFDKNFGVSYVFLHYSNDYLICIVCSINYK